MGKRGEVVLRPRKKLAPTGRVRLVLPPECARPRAQPRTNAKRFCQMQVRSPSRALLRPRTGALRRATRARRGGHGAPPRDWRPLQVRLSLASAPWAYL